MEFLRSLNLDGIARQAGTAIVVWPLGEIDANAFVRFMLHVRRLPERVLLVRTRVDYVPHLPLGARGELTSLGNGMQLIDIRYGFDDDPDVPQALNSIRRLELDPSATRYYVVDDRAAARSVKGLPRWRKWLFVMMSAACMPAAEYFHLPAEHTTEIQAGSRR